MGVRTTTRTAQPAVALPTRTTLESRPWRIGRLASIAVTVAVALAGCEPEPLRPTSYSPADIGFAELSVAVAPAHPTSFRPRADLPSLDASLPVDWAADPFYDRNWQFQLHAWRNMDFALRAYADGGDVEWLRRVLDIALDWKRFHFDHGGRSDFAWHDHATGLRASRLAFLLDRILAGELVIGDADLEDLLLLADRHARKLQDPDFLAPGNHAVFQLAGLDGLCEAASWRRACASARSYARDAFVELVRTQFTEEGVHTENSPSYHLGIASAVGRITANGRFALPEVTRTIERARAVAPWLTWPNGDFVEVGDSGGNGPLLPSTVTPTCLDQGGCWAVGDYSRSGYAIVRSLPSAPPDEASLLFIKGPGKLQGHKHADELGFVLMAHGRKIFVDSGSYGYNHDEARRHVVSAKAHSIPSLAGRELGPKDVDVEAGRLEPVRVVDSRFVVQGSVERRRRIRGGFLLDRFFRHERTFRYAPGDALTITDRMHNRTNSRWVSNLHLAADLEPVPAESGFSVRVGDRLVRAEFRGEGCEIAVVEGETDPYQGWVTVGYLELAPAPVVSATCPADLVDTEWRIDLNAVGGP